MMMPGELICAFAPGCVDAATLILTDRGERRADTIRIGDSLITAFGRKQRVKWVGCRSFGRHFISGNGAVRPVRIEVGAFGPNIPRRALHVSPQLGFFLGGSLIPAWCLVNGSTVRILRAEADVNYLQLELEAHDIMLAEGAPAETYIVNDDRQAFHNAEEYYMRYPRAPRGAGARVAPLLAGGPHVDLIRARLARRAESVPHRDAAEMTGQLETADARGSRGWVCPVERPDQPVRPEIAVNRQRMGAIIAHEPRPGPRKT